MLPTTQRNAGVWFYFLEILINLVFITIDFLKIKIHLNWKPTFSSFEIGKLKFNYFSNVGNEEIFV